MVKYVMRKPSVKAVKSFGEVKVKLFKTWPMLTGKDA